MSDREPADIRDRRRASGLDGGLDGSLVVEAGAGTGKTTVLIDRMLSLVRDGCELQRIVAITFTEKAAAELRVRLRAKLEKAAGEADGTIRKRLRTALLSIDQARVETIHAFCTGLLHERPVEAGVDPSFTVSDKLRTTVVLRDTWNEWIASQFARELPPAVAEARRAGLTLEKMKDIALRMVEQRELLAFAPDPAPPGDIESFLDLLQAESAHALRQAAAHCDNPDDTGAVSIRAFADDVATMSLLPDRERASFALWDVTPFPPRSRGNKKFWDEDVLSDLRGRAERLFEVRAELRAAAMHNVAVGLIQWARGFVESYQAGKRRLGLLDFEDLLVEARNLLRDNLEVREHFKRSFDRVLVDEFQDTDPLQCEIAFFLSEKAEGRATDWREVDLAPGKLFIVGDPKQSIYRFRHADIETYEAAKELVGGAGDVLKLTENFRTRPEITRQVNRVFEETMHAPDDGGRYQPDYAPLNAFRESRTGNAGVILLPPPSELPDKPKANQIRGLEARTVAAFLSWVIKERAIDVFDRDASCWRPVALGDIAILFHATAALDHYEEAFNAWELDYRIAGGKKFYARREVKELATTLAAIDDPHNAVAVVGALRTPFFGVSDDAIVLHRLRAGSFNYMSPAADGHPDVLASFAMLRELHERRDSDRVSLVISRLFEATRARELFLMKPTGEQRHANLMKVIELALSIERTETFSFTGFVRWLGDVSQLAPEEAESPLSEEGDSFVRMLTIHKAKGLEFPVTVLADLGRRKVEREKVVIDRETGRLAVGFGPKESRVATLDYEVMSDTELLRAEAERLRLLYVAATRARDALIVPWFEGGRDAAKLLDRLAPLREAAGGPRTDLNGHGGVVEFSTSTLDLERIGRRSVRLDWERASEIDPETTAAARELREWEERRNVFAADHDRPLMLLSPSALERHPERLEPEDEAASETTESEARGAGLRPSGLEFGSLVHAVMERIDLARPEEAGALATSFARAAGLDERYAEEATAVVATAMSSGIMRRAAKAAFASREVPFCLSVGDAVLEGTIDLLIEEDDGLVIVDYKTDDVEGASSRALAERYRRQADAYALAMDRITGAPVKEVVLLFMRGPVECRVEPTSDGSIEDLLAATGTE